MRRKDRELADRKDIEPILRKCRVCRLAMISVGKPYVVPMNFGYEWDGDGLRLYFHSGGKGKKLEALKADPRVCFELDIEEGVTGKGDGPCAYSYAFSSIIGEGTVVFAGTDEEKRKGLNVLMLHQTGRGGWLYPQNVLDKTVVFKVIADSFEASRKLPI